MLRPTVSRSVLSWCQASFGAQDKNFLLSDNCGFVDAGRPLWREDEVCRLQLLVVLTSAVILGSESHGTDGHILLSQVRDSAHLVGPGARIHISKEQVAQLYSQALCSLFIASYDSQGYVEVLEFASTLACP
jgi:hypothetical protein